MIAPLENKRQVARQMGISRSSLYYRSTMRERDQKLKEGIQATLFTQAMVIVGWRCTCGETKNASCA